MNLEAKEFLIKIRNFKEQFFAPLNFINFKKTKKKKYLLCGMGGSHLAGDLLKVYDPQIDLIVHSDYHLPEISDLRERLVFIVSYSGNTQETISSLKSALKQKMEVIIVTLDGELLKLVHKYKLNAIVLPDLNLKPRLGVGLMFRALLKVINPQAEEKLKKLMNKFNYQNYEKKGKNLVKKIKNKIPIIYSSFQNLPLANYFKISFNETSKIPSFINYFPELNHNEMVGWFYQKNLNQNFGFIFLEDEEDSFLIKKRMKILKNWLKKEKFTVLGLKLAQDRLKRIFESVLISLFASFYLANLQNFDPADESLIDKFKNLFH